MKKKFHEKFQSKSNFELQEIILNETNYQKEAVVLANEILTNRKSNSEKQINHSGEKKILFIPEKTSYEFKHSLEEKILVILSIIFFSYFGVTGYFNGSKYYIIVLLLALTIVILNRNVFSNKPEIIINQKGIWTSSHGQTNWSN